MRIKMIEAGIASALLLAAPAVFANGSDTQTNDQQTNSQTGSGYSGSQSNLPSTESGSSYSGSQATSPSGSSYGQQGATQQQGSTTQQQQGAEGYSGTQQAMGGVYGVIQHVDAGRHQLTLIVPAGMSQTFRQIGNTAELTREQDMVSLRVKVDPSATVDRSGQKSSLSDLKMGDNVKVTFDPTNSKIASINATPLSEAANCGQQQAAPAATP